MSHRTLLEDTNKKTPIYKSHSLSLLKFLKAGVTSSRTHKISNIHNRTRTHNYTKKKIQTIGTYDRYIDINYYFFLQQI